MAFTSIEDWVVLHQDLSPANLMRTGYHRAEAAEALARAKSEIARRGLTVTVTKDYYALAVAQRKYATAQQALDEAQQFLNISQAQEREGQAAHSDSSRRRFSTSSKRRRLTKPGWRWKTRGSIWPFCYFPTLNENFSVVDDLDSPTALPTFGEVQTMASRDNPDIRVAIETLTASGSRRESRRRMPSCRR